MGSATKNAQGRGRGPTSTFLRLEWRLRAALTAGKVLTAEQHKFLDGRPLRKHRCPACGFGGHARNGDVFRAANGVKVRR